MGGFPELQKIIDGCQFYITYSALSDEVGTRYIPCTFPLLEKVIPPDHSIDPCAYAEKIKAEFMHQRGCVLIPGRKFDAYGGRRGRGKGWYDKFLSKVPETWIKIGICHAEQFSREKLKLEIWDERMDWVIVKKDSIFSCYEMIPPPKQTFPS